MAQKLHTNHIALADILANGVAVLLILIILSLSIKQQDLAKESQQVSEIGSVMSREIASSLITNALPSSSPATLHNYNHPRRKNMPRIILHKNYLLIESAGDKKMLNLRLSKEELLQKNNRFDDFLKQLSSKQKASIRADIVHIKSYYLLMSIIKTHKAHIADWHFTGSPNAVGSGDYLLSENEDATLETTEETLPAELPPTPESENGLLTESVDFFLGDFGNSETLFSGLEAGETLIDFGNGFGITAQSLRADLQRYMAQSLGIKAENAHFVKTLNIDFSGGGSISGEQMSQSGQSAYGKELPAVKKLLAVLLGYLAHQQSRHQAGEFVEITADDFIKAKFKPLYQAYQTEIDSLYDNINAVNLAFIEIQHKTAKLSDTGLSLTPNQHLQKADLFTQENVPIPKLKENKLSIKLYPAPTINQGIRIEVNANDVVLLPYKHNQNNQPHWQLIAILDAQLSDVQIGFVYAKPLINKLDKIGLTQAKAKPKQLQIIAQENDIRLNQNSIEHYYTASKKAHYWQWGLLTAILIVFVLLLFSRHNRLTNAQ